MSNVLFLLEFHLIKIIECFILFHFLDKCDIFIILYNFIEEIFWLPKMFNILISF